MTRLTSRNPNPADSQAYYGLGMTLKGMGRQEEAYAAFYKAAWNYAWRSAAHYALAQVHDCWCWWFIFLLSVRPAFLALLMLVI